MTTNPAVIRVESMIIAPNADLSAHAVIAFPPSRTNPDGFHRLIGGSVEVGETGIEAIHREVDEAIGAVIHDLRHLTVLESIFQAESGVGHEVVFLFTGRLDPTPAATGATMTEADGTVFPLVWRPFDQELPPPLFPAATGDWLREVAG
ncbi:MAG: NUDIX domain-containing protein [Thermoleophilia bacterium]